jgi:hypothetical protein
MSASNSPGDLERSLSDDENLLFDSPRRLAHRSGSNERQHLGGALDRLVRLKAPSHGRHPI